MDTSKNYYDSVMRDFQTYGRGRTLEQYCGDEAVDYKWLIKAQSQYGTPEKTTKAKAARRNNTKTPDMIQLHFEAEPSETTSENTSETVITASVAQAPEAKSEWSVSSLKIITPQGHEIEIRTSNLSAVSELLSTLSA